MGLSMGAGWIALVVAGCAPPPSPNVPPLQTVPFVDIERYVGKWYEIASYPTIFNADCTATTAEYAIRDDGTVQVINECRLGDPSGPLDRIEGTARVVNEATNAELKVSFFLFAEGDYWIIELDEDYQWAVVGDPARQTLFILSRTPTLDHAVYQQLLDLIRADCYDPDLLELTVQVPDGG
jgi:apolipoprotein D and lipocalin family protein